ncbi:MAG: hypothetical protein GDA68_21960 [Nitrospira sp. CR2.1]|nr:hypothetical protein [Nitrospira sp. CR2.1]MBA5875211.1 hypothetical protein [Nitrospira sp. CR1.2]
MINLERNTQAFANIPREMKARLRRIKARDREKTESYLIKHALEKTIPDVERELGIFEPVQKPRSRKNAV